MHYKIIKIGYPPKTGMAILSLSFLRSRTRSIVESRASESILYTLTFAFSNRLSHIFDMFMQNKPNFRSFNAKNTDCDKKQTQNKADSNLIKAKIFSLSFSICLALRLLGWHDFRLKIFNKSLRYL